MRLPGLAIVSALALVAFAAVQPAAAEPGDLLSIDLAKIANKHLDGTAWGKATTVNDRPCRVLKASRDASVQAAAWWKNGLRPAEGKYFLVEVLYKDTAKEPIVLRVWAGVGRNESRTEIHRFGGLDDAKWKIAQVPLGWDMVMVRPHTRMVEFSIASPKGDVAVSTIRIQPLPTDKVSAAAERWNAETRAWVKRVQADLASGPHKEFETPQKPAVGTVDGKEAIVPYVRSWMTDLYPYSAPRRVRPA